MIYTSCVTISHMFTKYYNDQAAVNDSLEFLGSILKPQCDRLQNGSPELLGSILLVMN